MTLPTSDAQSSRSLPRRPNSIPVSHSMPASSPVAPIIPNASSPATHVPVTPTSMASQAEGFPVGGQRDNAVNFASHSWDLATGGLKTMTAKREMPSWQRRPSVQTSEPTHVPRNYVFLLVILVCLLLMLVSGGVILFVMLQP